MAVADTQTALLHCKNRHKNRCVNLYIIFTAKYVRETNVINGETTCTKKPIFSHLCLLKKLQVLHASPTTNRQTTCSIFLRPAGSSMYGSPPIYCIWHTCILITHVGTWIMGVEMIKWHNSAMYGCRSKSVGTGLDWCLGCMPALPVTQSTAAVAVCCLWCYTGVIPLALPFTCYL